MVTVNHVINFRGSSIIRLYNIRLRVFLLKP
uniref:Uncharacterized protein n=1 Tax=Anguilla anguilla TaxID=7936 RepID=A0A0E9SBH0_ANGAN